MKGRSKVFVLTAVCFFVCAIATFGQNSYELYISKYSPMAVEQMQRYKIPASITLAQGLLESRAGESLLARKANNHFGIKCGSIWTGPYLIQDDDYKNERFRVYKNARESYEDHSRFLQQRRYLFLFSLRPTDYKGWAHGLKKAGYATNPQYAYSLINIIERYNLTRFDTKSSRKEMPEESVSKVTHQVYFNNKNYYIICREGDSMKGISKEMGVSQRRLRRYNELDKSVALKKGTVLYMEKKQRRADKKYKKIPHIVTVGESYYDISQRYGIRLKSLYKLNGITPEHSIQIGERLRLR